MAGTLSKENVIQKIQKLLALADKARNTSEGEASAAASKAQELLDTYNLTMSEVGTDEQKKGDKPKSFDGLFARNTLRQYQTSLFDGLARQFDCVCFIRTQRKWDPEKMKSKKTKSLCVVGHEADVEVFKWTFEYLLEAIERIYKVEIKAEDLECREEMGRKMTWSERREYRLSYCLGAVHRILERVRGDREERLQKDNKCTAMVLVRKAAVDKWVDENMKLKAGRCSPGERRNAGAYRSGVSAANTISLRKGVGGGSGSNKRIK